MKHKIKTLFILVLISSLFAQNEKESRIIWDKWTVPHIYAQNESDLFYLFGKAQMKLHANLLLKKYGEARGKAAEYWGEKYLNNDILIRKLGIPKRSEKWFESQNEKMKSLLSSFVRGINDYAKDNPDEIDESLKIVLPVQVTDQFSLLQYTYHYKVAAFALQSDLEQWRNAGSNAWAIAPSKSAGGNSMLLIQPHPPWLDDYRFIEAHLVCGDLNVYGIAQVGSPLIAMGFNENLGWGFTFNQADTYDLYEVKISGDGYYIDNKFYQFETRQETISYIENGRLITEKLIFKTSVHGNILEEKNGKAIAVRISGLDSPGMVQQLYEMAKAKNRVEFEKAVAKLQLPLQNIVFADKYGDIGYIYNGIIPKREKDDFGYWARIQDGNDISNLVKDYHTFEDLPKFANPGSGFISNTNNPPWSSTYPPAISPNDYPGYFAPNFIDERTIRSLKILIENQKISFDDLEKFQADTKSRLADKYIEQLIEYAANTQDPLLSEAAEVLTSWDRSTKTGSKGAVLFAQWYFSAEENIPRINPDIEKALFQNAVLPSEAKQKLKEATNIVKQKYGSLDIEWGEVYRIFHAGQKYPSALGLNELGSFQAGFYRPDQENKFTLIGGAAFSLIVEFGEKVKARALLPYGNSTQDPDGQQILLMNSGKMRQVNFYEENLFENK